MAAQPLKAFAVPVTAVAAACDRRGASRLLHLTAARGNPLAAAGSRRISVGHSARRCVGYGWEAQRAAGVQPSGPRLVAFLAVMYYAALRPEEAVNLGIDNIILPPRISDAERPQLEDPHGDQDWGALHLRTATPDAGSEWTDDGSLRERRQLKRRAEGDIRMVPTHPELTRLLRDHLASFGSAEDGHLFARVRGGELPTITYRRAQAKARQVALTPTEQASPLARRPYDLLHACLSTWLNGGVYPTQVAEWAGHGVDVLPRIYAKCVVGQDELARRRISEALRQD